MKKFNLWALMAISAMFIFSACNKEESVNAPTLLDPSSSGRNSGVVPDASATIAKVPIYVSSEFVQNGGSFSSYVHPNNRGGNNNQSKGVRAVRDVTAPTVTITSPANGATVSGTVFISINASDDYALASVTLSVNGTVLTSWTTAPFSTSWTPATDGNYTLTATAKDKNSNSASHSIIVTRSTNSTSTGGGGTTTTPPTTLPSSFIMATPPIMDQGGEGSCLSMALDYQRSIEAYYRTNSTSYSISTNILSPEFLYNYTKIGSSCGSGATMLYSLEFIKIKEFARGDLYHTATKMDVIHL